MSDQQKIVDAVLYAMRCGCFFPVPNPTAPYSVEQLVKWGAMRNLHTAVAEYGRATAAHGEPTPAKGVE